MTRALLEQALDALECAYSEKYDGAKFYGAKAALRAHLAKPQGEPAWHDKPTAPGVWVVGSRCLHINELDLPIYERSNCRWYGPLPEDNGGKP